MKKIYFAAIITLSVIRCFSQAPSIQWQKSFGGTVEEQAKCILQTSDGGYIIAGNTNSNDGDVSGNHLYEGSPYWDAWVVKLNANGEIEWQKAFGGSEGDGFNSIIQTSDGGYIACGHTSSTDGDVIGEPNSLIVDYYWIVKLTSLGEIEWQNRNIIGQTGSQAIDIKPISGGYIVVGTCYAVTGNFGYGDSFVMRLNSQGAFEWQEIFGETWSIDNLSSVAETSDGGFIAAGSKSPIGGNDPGFDYYLIKFASDGSLEWEKTYGGSEWEEAQDVIGTEDGGLVAVGYTRSNNLDVSGIHESTDGNVHSDVWILRLDASGNILWQKCLGGYGDDRANSIQKTSDGYVIAGYTNSTDGDVTFNNGSYDYWILKIDNSGNLLWQKSLGGGSVDEAISLCSTADEGYAMVGNTRSYGGDVTFNNGFQDFWAVKLTNENLSRNESSKNLFAIYPNPTTGKIYLENLPLSESAEYEIYNNLGQITKSGKVKTNQSLKLDGPNGVYMLKIEDGENVMTKKIILKK